MGKADKFKKVGQTAIKGIGWLVGFLVEKVIGIITGTADYVLDKAIRSFTLYILAPVLLIISLLLFLAFRDNTPEDTTKSTLATLMFLTEPELDECLDKALLENDNPTLKALADDEDVKLSQMKPLVGILTKACDL